MGSAMPSSYSVKRITQYGPNPADAENVVTSCDLHVIVRVCQLGVTDFVLIYFRPAERRPSKAMSKAFSAGFQRIDQRRCPAPVGSRLMMSRLKIPGRARFLRV